MTINTWASFSKRRNSTKQPTGGTQKSVTLKSPTSLINPVFLLESFSLSDNYLQWGDRYYFIDDIILVNNSLAEYHCSVDALASWKSSIGSMNEYVVRAASSYDGAIADFLYPCKAGESEETQSFSDLHAETASFRVSGGGGYFIVGVYGATGDTGSITYWKLTPTEYSQLTAYMFSNAWLDQNQTDICEDTQKQLVNPMQYIASCIWFPFDGLASIGVADNMSFGWWQTNLGAEYLEASDRKYILSDQVSISRHPDRNTRGKYVDDSPFTRHELFCWAFGSIPIDPAALVDNDNLILQIDVDLFTGAGILMVLAGQVLIGEFTAQLGVPMQMAQLTSNIASSVLSIGSAVANGFIGNFLGAASAIGDTVQSWMPQVNATGTTGSCADYMFSPRVVSTFKRQTSMDATHNGRPLCQNVSIGSLSGYIKTENVDVDIPCTQEERDIIAGYMDGGFYYE